MDADMSGVTLRFDGSTLVIASSVGIARVDAVSLDGIVLARIAPAATEASLDASRWPCDICIVSVTLADGTKHVYTLSR